MNQMKEKIKQIFNEYYNDETMPVIELENKVLALFDVVGRMDEQKLNEALHQALRQTAVDWLVEQFKKQGFLYDLDIEAAKQMEKEQMQNIIDAYVTGILKDKNINYGIEYLNKLEDYMEEGKNYYNKTYKQ